MNSQRAATTASMRLIEAASNGLAELWSCPQGDRRAEGEHATARLAWLASRESPRTNYRVRAKVMEVACRLIERIAQNDGRDTLNAIENALANTATGPRHTIDNYGAVSLRVYALRHLARCDPANAIPAWVQILKLMMIPDGFHACQYALRHRRGSVHFEEREANWAIEATEELARTSRETIHTRRLRPIGNRIRGRLPGVERDRRLRLADRFDDTLEEIRTRYKQEAAANKAATAKCEVSN